MLIASGTFQALVGFPVMAETTRRQFSQQEL